MKRAVLYLRVSTTDQTTANQERELREVASRMGCEIVRVYKDHGMLLAGRLRETDAVIAAGSFLPNEGRLACTLLELAGDFGQDVGDGRTVIRQKICQSDLAAMAGIARESACRIINDWERRKMISRLSGFYCIENKDQLQREAELSAY